MRGQVKMKKKVFAALMAGVMIFSLTACGKYGKNENSVLLL